MPLQKHWCFTENPAWLTECWIFTGPPQQVTRLLECAISAFFLTAFEQFLVEVLLSSPCRLAKLVRISFLVFFYLIYMLLVKIIVVLIALLWIVLILRTLLLLEIYAELRKPRERNVYFVVAYVVIITAGVHVLTWLIKHKLINLRFLALGNSRTDLLSLVALPKAHLGCRNYTYGAWDRTNPN